MILTTFRAWFTARSQPKERRKNHAEGSSPGRHAINNARMHRTLVEISNKTRAQMDDAKFREWAQDEAHFLIEELGRTSK